MDLVNAFTVYKNVCSEYGEYFVNKKKREITDGKKNVRNGNVVSNE